MNTSTKNRNDPGQEFASRSVARHLARGAIGFGLIIGSIALVPSLGPVALVIAPLGLIAFRGCPTCWIIGLTQTISRGRLQRVCVDGSCTLTRADAAGHDHAGAGQAQKTS